MEIQKILFPEVGRCTEKELYFRTEQECSSVSGDIPDEQTLFENEKNQNATTAERHKNLFVLHEFLKLHAELRAKDESPCDYMQSPDVPLYR